MAIEKLNINAIIGKEDVVKQPTSKIDCDYSQLTQKNGTRQLNMKKFPEVWYEILKELKKKDPTAPSPSAYALKAVKKQMERDGLL